MSDYDDYGYGYGDDYDRDGDDYGYGDDYDRDGDDYGYGDDYDYYDEKQMTFSYRDIGEEGRIGGIVDEDLDLPMGGHYGDLRFKINLDPKIVFINEVQRILRNEVHLNLSDEDQSIIKKSISKIPLIEYKNPLMYVLGYYFQMDISDKKYTDKKIKKIQKEYTNQYITMFEILKYAKFWTYYL
jgi:hypothetical protein